VGSKEARTDFGLGARGEAERKGHPEDRIDVSDELQDTQHLRGHLCCSVLQCVAQGKAELYRQKRHRPVTYTGIEPFLPYVTNLLHCAEDVRVVLLEAPHTREASQRTRQLVA
jgi:hypothetical protein